MNSAQIDRFFKTLSDELNVAATAILTGAAAARILGNARPSMDIDFALKVKSRTVDWNVVDAAIKRTIQKTGLQADYAEDIDRWGMISLLDYAKQAEPYKKFGALRVRVMDPAYWSIGKMTRYLEPDVRDMVSVFKVQKTPAKRLINIWGRAVKASPKSAALKSFLNHAGHFFRTHGRSLWGAKFDGNDATNALLRRARA